MNSKQSFKWKHFQGEIILLCVRWYLRYALSYRNLEEIIIERVSVDHTTTYRWLMIYAPQIEEKARKDLKSTNDSWRVDETYIKVKRKWKYLYKAVDSSGKTLDFMLSANRNTKAAKRFLIKVLKSKHNKQPRVINIDKNPAYPPAMEELKKSGIVSTECQLRQNKYLNNIIEQEHRFAKKLAKYKSYLQFFHTAWRTLRGYEIKDAMSEVASDILAVRMNAIGKSQIENVSKGDILVQRDFIHSLFEIAVLKISDAKSFSVRLNFWQQNLFFSINTKIYHSSSLIKVFCFG